MSDRTRIYVGVCIYCGATDNLTNEHAIPYALKGERILEKASCLDCNKITTRFERSILRRTMIGVRTVLELPTRREKDRPAELPLIFIRGNQREEHMVPVADAIPVLVLPELGPPEVLPNLGHLRGLMPGEFLANVHTVNERSGTHLSAMLRKYSADAIEVPWEIDHQDFRRMIAKIAMCEAITIYGYHSFHRLYVRDAVLGRDRASYWVGSDGCYDIYAQGGFEDSSHVVAAMRPRRQEEVWMRVKLWQGSLTPEYTVVVGRLRQGYARLLDAHNLIA